jgi:hypothetical protein
MCSPEEVERQQCYCHHAEEGKGATLNEIKEPAKAGLQLACCMGLA